MSIDDAYRNGMLQATENAEERYSKLLARLHIVEGECDALLSRVIELERSEIPQSISMHSSDGAQDNSVDFIPENGAGAAGRLRRVDGQAKES